MKIQDNKLNFDYLKLITCFIMISCFSIFSQVGVYANDFEKNWVLQGSSYITDEGYLVLTESNNWDKGEAWYRNEVIGSYIVEFKYKIGNGTGADGLVFAFNKSSSNIGEFGGMLNFSDGGYGIEFDTYYNSEYNDPTSQNHIAFMDGRVGNHISYYAIENLDDFEWHHAKIEVSSNQIIVSLDNIEIINYKGDISQNYKNIGFLAATGKYTNWHMIDLNSFKLKQIDELKGGRVKNIDNNHTYFLYEEPLNWIEAEKTCRLMGGYLATITSNSEQEFMMNKVLSNSEEESYFIGGIFDSSNWKWITEEEFSLYYNSGDQFNRYLSISMKDKIWESNEETIKKGYICEWAPIIIKGSASYYNQTAEKYIPIIHKEIQLITGNEELLFTQTDEKGNFNIEVAAESYITLSILAEDTNIEILMETINSRNEVIEDSYETYKISYNFENLFEDIELNIQLNQEGEPFYIIDSLNKGIDYWEKVSRRKVLPIRIYYNTNGKTKELESGANRIWGSELLAKNNQITGSILHIPLNACWSDEAIFRKMSEYLFFY